MSRVLSIIKNFADFNVKYPTTIEKGIRCGELFRNRKSDKNNNGVKNNGI